jgi:hypothetical protein
MWMSLFARQDLPWFLPEGWADQGRAVKIRIYHAEMLEPLKSRGIRGLLSSEERFLELNESLQE